MDTNGLGCDCRLAWHVPCCGKCSPMTGSGFHYALLDVLSLRHALTGADRERDAQRLTRFEQARLADDRQLALYGQRQSRDYLASF
jgi:2-polyprenyl-6-methoxyphenol hydroxylase-like FAD-dependent oxidoreductase